LSLFYLLQLGEVWYEIASELPAEGVRPTTPDREAVEAMTRAALERAKGVAMLQAELLEAEAQQNLHDEKQFYAEVKNSQVLTRDCVLDLVIISWYHGLMVTPSAS